MENMVGLSEVQPGAACFQRQYENRRGVFVRLEAFYHPVASLLDYSSVQEEYLSPKSLLKIALQDAAHLRKLGKNQRSLSQRQDLLHHFGQSGQFPGAAGGGGGFFSLRPLRAGGNTASPTGASPHRSSCPA